jgi:HD-GYP domain-containing protein (c-di-GMP phosphodiesterase class II)
MRANPRLLPTFAPAARHAAMIQIPTCHQISTVDLSIHGLLELMEARDPQLLAHSLSVARLSARIGAVLDLPEPRIDELRRAALIHDVGKLAVADAVLNKPGPLTSCEYDRVRIHPVVGSRLALGLSLHREAAWVRHHHERPDGHGYPDGLAEGEIPIESAIIHVADAYDALTSDRPYREAMTRGGALRAIIAGSGRDFDRDCVSALVSTTARRF